MTKTPAVRGLLAGFVLLVGSVTQTLAQQYTPIQLMDPRLAPKHDDVSLSTPTSDEIKNCTVELVKGDTKSSGFILKDSNKKTLRRFLDSNGDNKINIWSYYKDGVEVYREFDTTYNAGLPNNFRWLNAGGMKWGVGGVNAGKAYIDSWRMISAEEVGFEAFQAIAKRDYARLKSLFITDSDMQMLKLAPAASDRISKTQQSASKKFDEITKKLTLEGARFERLESAIPGCTTEDSSEGIVIKYASRPILYSLNKQHEWLHTGEIIQVGMAWRLVDVPSPEGKDPVVAEMPKELQKLYDEISELDRTQPPPVTVLSKDAKVDAFYRTRIALVQKIIPLDKAEQRETWYKQLFDNLTSLAQNSGEEKTIDLLKQMKDDVVVKMPGSNLAAYGHYRFMWTGYAIGMATAKTPKEISALQEKWLEQLSDFVKKYARAEDTPEALHQLAIGTEFSGQDEAAKRWYTQLYDNFPDHNLAPRAKGAVARLNLPGRELKLTAPHLDDNSKTFDVSQLRGKFVLVHYWASYTNNFANDFVLLKRTMNQIGQKYSVELVCVNLDDTAEAARAALKGLDVPGHHLFQAPSNNAGGGLSSPLAVQYGIHMLPTMFMVGKDGKVTSRALQVADIETELKRVQ